MMTIAAFSDSHSSSLPPIEEHVDVVCIAGDISPLNIQRDQKSMIMWFEVVFLKWCRETPAKLILLVPGNHDFLFESRYDYNEAIAYRKLENKVKVLINESYTFDDVVFYGCPCCISPRGWAFISDKFYKIIPKCDVLICHQAPSIEKVGCSYPGLPWERDFGSRELAKKIWEINPRMVFCGHIHSGQHYAKDNGTEVYNVSLLDEDYTTQRGVTWTNLE